MDALPPSPPKKQICWKLIRRFFPSILEKRLKSRGSEVVKEIDERIEKAKFEITQKEYFDVILMNDEFDKASLEIYEIIKNFMRE